MTSAIPKPVASRFRWVVCALLFAATTIAYIDRGVFGYLKGTLQTIIGWDDIQYGYISASFKIAYGIGLVTAGWFTDRLGTKKGFAIAIVLWSFAAMSPGIASTVFTFGLAMFFLGLGEAANFPACIKTVAEWFPRKERALATGVFNSGANVGNMLVPLVVPLLAGLVGWRGAFGVCGATGFVWLAFWLWLYERPEEHPRVSPGELAYIQSDPAEKINQVPWLKLLPRKETWAFALGKFLTDPVWWFYTFWLPGYWQRTFRLDPAGSQMRLSVMLSFGIAILGSVYGGYISAALLKRNKTLNYSRKIALLLCALGVLPVMFVPFSQSLWVTVGLVCLAMAAHQGWSANLFTVTSDLFPKAAVASVVGIGGMVGAVGGALFDVFVGHVVQWTNSYVPVFAISGVSYLLALLILHGITPKYVPAKLERA